MGGSGRDAFDDMDDAVPPEADGGVSLLESFGLRMVEASDDIPRICVFILNDDGVVARIEHADDGSLAWFGHWRGGTNVGTADTWVDVILAVVDHFTRTVGRTPWRLLAQPSVTVGAVR